MSDPITVSTDEVLDPIYRAACSDCGKWFLFTTTEGWVPTPGTEFGRHQWQPGNSTTKCDGTLIWMKHDD